MRKKWLCLTMLLASMLAVQLAAAQDLGASANGAPAQEAQPGLLSFDPQQAIWVLAIFLILVVILYRTAWKNVLAGLKAREQRIRTDITDAEAARARAEGTLREYTQKLTEAENQVRDILARAAADAEKLAQSIRMQAQNESQDIKERATREIEATKNQALREVYEQTANLATTVAEKILRRNISADDQRDLVQQSLEQMQEIRT